MLSSFIRQFIWGSCFNEHHVNNMVEDVVAHDIIVTDIDWDSIIDELDKPDNHQPQNSNDVSLEKKTHVYWFTSIRSWFAKHII